MNFLKFPEPKIHDKAVVDAEQTQVAVGFVEELLDLVVIQRTPLEGVKILTNAPLFVVPKEGQEEEWHVIADMLRGGQNKCMRSSNFTMEFPFSRSDVCTRLLSGSGCVKVLIPVPDSSGQPSVFGFYEYLRLPMGGANSPGIACKHGLAFIRMLREHVKEFQGNPQLNCWWTGFSELGYDLTLGYDINLIGKEGRSYKIWAFVDNFLIHGPDHEKTCCALLAFLDLSVDCGMLCHPLKVIPPQQVVKYYGFLLDSRAIPCLCVPISKRKPAVAIVDHLLESQMSIEYSQLSLAVAAGMLQSLAETTPSRLGHTYLG
jgi:hypothetical protein